MKVKIGAVLLLLMLSGLSYGQSREFILTTSHDHIINEVKKYYNIKSQAGRITKLELKKGITSDLVPLSIKKHVKSFLATEVLQISHSQLPFSIPGQAQINNEVGSLLNQVDTENIYQVTKKITDQENRRSGAPGNQWTTTFVEQEFKKNNLLVERDCFSPGLCNVIGTQSGKFEKYIVIEAHMDSVGKPFAGADDNASGVAALLEIMRLTAKLNGEMGLIFFATNGEESGLLGSKTFVANAKKSGLIDKLAFVINMDMIAYNKNGQVDIETDRKYEDVAKWYAKIFATYTQLKANITMPAWGSDHVPFLRSGVPGVLTIEHWNTRNPCYHKICDTIDNLNMDYAAEITKANLAAVYLKAKLKLKYSQL
jgi:hypothetical protein